MIMFDNYDKEVPAKNGDSIYKYEGVHVMRENKTIDT
jgi:hypothetical protein